MLQLNHVEMPLYLLILARRNANYNSSFRNEAVTSTKRVYCFFLHRGTILKNS